MIVNRFQEGAPAADHEVALETPDPLPLNFREYLPQDQEDDREAARLETDNTLVNYNCLQPLVPHHQLMYHLILPTNYLL